MLLRERRRSVAASIYHAQLLAAGLNIKPELFDVWTMLYVDEVGHDNYRPSVAKEKRKMLDVFSNQRRMEKALVERTDQYSIQSTKDMQPYGKAEREEILKRLRKRALKNSTRDTK